MFYRQISNTQWKKYVENGKDQSRMVLETNTSNGRRLDQKKPGVLGSPSIPNNPGFGYNGVSGGPQSSTPNKKSDRKIGQVSEKREADKSVRGSGLNQSNGDARKLQNPKTAPSSYGYNGKRTSISSVSSNGSTSRTSTHSRTKELHGSSEPNPNTGATHSLERPRTKIKVSGGTQTTNELQYIQGSQNTSVHSDGEYSSNSLGRKYQVKSYSLNGPAAAQLSQNVRERIMQSPYTKVHMGSEYAAAPPPGSSPFSSPYYRERSPRIKPTDGSLSDSPYTNYSDLQYSTSPYMWTSPRGNYSGSVASAPTR